jgi:hypothetical protein
MCKFCENKKELDVNDSSIKAIILKYDDGYGILLSYSAYSVDSSFDDIVIDITYCPMCGKKITI